MDLQEIRNLVRSHLDLEEEDLPNPLLDAFAREASHRIEQAERYWPFYQQVFTYAIPAAEASTALTTIDANLTEIAAAVREDGSSLRFVGAHEFERRRLPEQSGTVTFFTQWGDTVFWGPVPADATNVSIRGYRRAEDWVASAGGVPDMPVELHNTIFLWCLAKAYFQQEDEVLGAAYERQFNDELNLYRRRFTQMTSTQPFVLGGNTRSALLRPPVYDWQL